MRSDKPIRYVRFWVTDLHDPSLYRLTLAHRGVYWALHLLSGYASDVGGMFVINDVPMTLREIQNDLHCATPAEEKAVAEAIRQLMASGLLGQAREHGWYLTRWERDQASYNRETKAESNARVRRWRAKKQDEKRAQLQLVPRR